ncbi:hypothetical protein ACEUZ9_002777 [Paracoccus litorisediminis]|uniref:hypothetical protein n=1 Tax=Paracoccus litorisediminis TaxID=2006130 RepID=UPI0037318FBD
MDMSFYPLFSDGFSPANGFIAVAPFAGLSALTAWLTAWPFLKRARMGSGRKTHNRSGPRISARIKLTGGLAILAAPVLIAAQFQHEAYREGDLRDARVRALHADLLEKHDILPLDDIRDAGVAITWFKSEGDTPSIRRAAFRNGSLNLANLWRSQVQGQPAIPAEPSHDMAVARVTAAHLLKDEVGENALPVWCIYHDGELYRSHFIGAHRRSLEAIADLAHLHLLCPDDYNPRNEVMQEPFLPEGDPLLQLK